MENILIQSMKQAIVLPANEQRELVKEFQTTGSKMAMERLINSNIRLAAKFAREYRRDTVEFEDLLVEAISGIMRAATMYQIDSAASFTSYCAQWMRAYCQEFVQENCSTIRVGTRTAKKLFGSLQRIRRQYGPDVSPEVIASELGLDQEDVEETLRFLGRKAQSLDAPINPSGGTVATLIPDEKVGQEEMLRRTRLIEQVREAKETFSKTLNERDEMIFSYRVSVEHEDKMGLQELGDLFGVSKERVRQLESRIVKNFRNYLEGSITER